MTIPAEYKPEYLLAIGHIEAEWNQVEALLFAVFAHFIGARTPKAHAAYFSLVNHRARRDMIESLAPHVLRRPAQMRKFNGLIRRVKNAAQKRNEVIHTFWGWQNGKPWALWPEQTDVPTDNLLRELRTRAQTISSVRADLTAFYLKLPNNFHSWPPKRQQPYPAHPASRAGTHPP